MENSKLSNRLMTIISDYIKRLLQYLRAAALGGSSAGDGHLNPTTDSAWLAQSERKKQFYNTRVTS